MNYYDELLPYNPAFKSPKKFWQFDKILVLQKNNFKIKIIQLTFSIHSFWSWNSKISE